MLLVREMAVHSPHSRLKVSTIHHPIPHLNKLQLLKQLSSAEFVLIAPAFQYLTTSYTILTTLHIAQQRLFDIITSPSSLHSRPESFRAVRKGVARHIDHCELRDAGDAIMDARSAYHHLQLRVSKDNLKRFCQMRSWIGQCWT